MCPCGARSSLPTPLLPNPFTAVTGTNGKTTTTALVGHMFATAGRPARVLGNIGTAVSSVVGTLRGDEELVVELSSFQLEDVHDFRPAAGILLNLTPDHLDRHGTMERYLACKAALFARQGPEDWAVVNAGDPAVAGVGREILAREDGPRVAWFSTDTDAAARLRGSDAAVSWLEDGHLYLHGRRALSIDEVSLARNAQHGELSGRRRAQVLFADSRGKPSSRPCARSRESRTVCSRQESSAEWRT